MLFRVCSAGLLCCAAGGIAWGQVTLRSGERIFEPIELISVEGIVVRGAATTRLIGWERIEGVGGERASDARHFMPMAERAWRARIRLDRGDLALAEPLLAGLFEELRGRDGSVALLSAEGLMRCRLSRADVAGAFLPWLEAVRLRDRGVVLGGEESDGGLLDRVTLLSPALPPFFTPGQAAGVLDRSRGDGVALRGGSGASGALMDWYVRAASHDAGVMGAADAAVVDGESDSESGRAGVRFVSDLVLARTAADAAERAFHRNRLRVGLEQDIDTWREAWRRMGLGLSHLAEGDDENALLGVLELLHLPARFGTTQPQLAGLALAHASAALDRLGYGASAARLRDELRENFAGHPALELISVGSGEGVNGGGATAVDPLDGSAGLSGDGQDGAEGSVVR
jgi:hypothetical protein